MRTNNTQLYKNYRSHISKKMRTRFNIRRDPDMIMRTLCKCVEKGTFLENSKYSRKVYLVRAYNHPIVLVFDHYHNLPVTVMRTDEINWE